MLSKNNNKYFIPALNKMHSTEMRVSTELDSLWNSLNTCWKTIRDKGSHKSVHIPVIGMKFGRTNITFNQMIYFMVNSFLFSSSSESITKELYIHIYKSDFDKVDFIALKDWLTSFNE